MTARDLAVQSRRLDQHHRISYAPGKPYDRESACPTCLFEVAADAAGIYEHRLEPPTAADMARMWLDSHQQVVPRDLAA